MTIQGVYLEPIDIDSGEFRKFDKLFSNKLSALYEINYAEVVKNYLGAADEWGDTAYYHGTSHCGCVDKWVHNDNNERIAVRAWCESVSCSTKGIITRGHLGAKRISKDGMFSHRTLKV